jgi:hypothetical protein
MKNYKIQDREAGNKIDTFATLIEAQEALLYYEVQHKSDGSYKLELLRNN